MKYPAGAARAIAEWLIDRLGPACENIVIAGSLRRERPFVGDVEILFIPRKRTEPVDMFATKEVDLTDQVFDMLLAEGSIRKRRSSNGNVVWGAKNKLAEFHNGMPVDFFATTEENWWVSLVVRTGSKETNLKLTTGANKMLRSLNAYGCGVTSKRTGQVLQAHSEEEVFALCGVPYLDPSSR